MNTILRKKILIIFSSFLIFTLMLVTTSLFAYRYYLNNTSVGVLRKWIGDIEKQEVVQASQLVIDKRFSTQQELIKFYKSDSNYESIKGYKILSINKTSPDNVIINVLLDVQENKQGDKQKKIPNAFNLVKNNNLWKVYVKGYGS